MTYLSALTKLGKRDRRKIGHNTYLVRGDGYVDVVFHTTTVIRYGADGSVIYNSGGWQTKTTKECLNHWGVDRVRVYQKDTVWYVHDHTTDTIKRFYDGMRIR